MREIVTVQVGSFANFIGSHFWNFQDELLGLAADSGSDPVFKNADQYLNMDVLYRVGETQQGISTYTPRLVSIDYQGSLGSMSSHGTLYNANSSGPSDIATWGGNVSTLAAEPRKRNLFLQSLYQDEQEHMEAIGGVRNGRNDSQREISDQDIVDSLANSVEFWTDYSKVHYHPRSLYELNGLWMDSQELENYGVGRDIFSEGLRGEEMTERLRFFVEECDHIQGFQFIVDDSGAFSALAAEFLENIADEYSNVPVLLYSVKGPSSHVSQQSRKQTISRTIHDSLSFARLSSYCKLITPIGLPSLSKSNASTFLCIEDEKPYYCSAIYAAALHSLSLPYRMVPAGPTTEPGFVSGALDVNSIVQMLSGQSRQNTVVILDVAMPAPSISGKLNSLLGSLQSLTPETADDIGDLQAVESIVVHGTFKPGGKSASISEVTDAVNAAYESAATRPRFCHLSVARCPLPIPLPFPRIFSNVVSQHGEIVNTPVGGSAPRGSLDVHSIPMAARLRSSSAILPFLKNRLGNLRRFGIQQGAPASEIVRSWGFGKDDVEDYEESLHRLVKTLDDGCELTSDSDSE